MIREMRYEDWKRVSEIYGEGILEGTATFTAEVPSFEVWNVSHLKDCRFVFEENGEVLGFVAISPTSKTPAYCGVIELSMYVDKNHRKQGIGSMLMEKVIEESEKLGYWTLHSSIFRTNSASIALHNKFGFRLIGYREKVAKDRFGVWQDTVFMERRNSIL